MTITPLANLSITLLHLSRNAHSFCPNTSLTHFPLLLYNRAFPASASTHSLRQLLHQNSFTPQWTFGMYGFSHYHTVHEVLLILSGSATLRFGGESADGAVLTKLVLEGGNIGVDTGGAESVESETPVEVDVAAGDMIVVPAGVAHRHVVERDGFSMMGCYWKDTSWDMVNCRTAVEEETASGKIREVGPLEKDPLYGMDRESPVLKYWVKT